MEAYSLNNIYYAAKESLKNISAYFPLNKKYFIILDPTINTLNNFKLDNLYISKKFYLEDSEILFNSKEEYGIGFIDYDFKVLNFVICNEFKLKTLKLEKQEVIIEFSGKEIGLKKRNEILLKELHLSFLKDYISLTDNKFSIKEGFESTITDFNLNVIGLKNMFNKGVIDRFDDSFNAENQYLKKLLI